MIKLNNAPEPPRKKPPKNLVWAETFDFKFPVSMNEYIDRIKSSFSPNGLDELIPTTDPTDLLITRRVPRSHNIWLVASIQEIDQTSVRIVGKVGVSQTALTLTFMGLFIGALVFIFVFSPEITSRNSMCIIVGSISSLHIPFMILETKWMRSSLLKRLRQAGKEVV